MPVNRARSNLNATFCLGYVEAVWSPNAGGVQMASNLLSRKSFCFCEDHL